MNCPNCGKPGSHFVPPSLGDEGFFICETQKNKESKMHEDGVKELLKKQEELDNA